MDVSGTSSESSAYLGIIFYKLGYGYKERKEI